MVESQLGRLEEVTKALEAKGFEVEVQEREIDPSEAARGTVIGREPKDERLKKGTKIVLFVAKKPE